MAELPPLLMVQVSARMASKLAKRQERRSAIAWLRERLLPASVPKWAYAVGLALGSVTKQLDQLVGERGKIL